VHVISKELTQLLELRTRWTSSVGAAFIVNNRLESMKRVLLIGGFNNVVVVLEKGVMLRFEFVT
jgi:hypothetical protein